MAGNTLDMTKGVIWRQILRFALPTAAGILFQQMYNVADTLIVGQFVSKEALAAVGATGSITNMLLGLSVGLSTGAGVVVSQCYGLRDMTGLRKAVHVALLMTLILGLGVTVPGIILVGPLLDLMRTPADIYAGARTYLVIYCLGLCPLFLYNMGAGILRAVGDSRRPLYYLCISSVVHIGLDLLFVMVFSMGVAGVAWATLLTQVLSAGLILIAMTREGTPYRIRRKELKMDGPMAKRILSIGLPAGLQQALTSFSMVYIQSAINFFGSTVIAAWTVHNKLDSLLLIPQEAIATSCSIFVGQNYGANRPDRIRRGVCQAIAMSAGITAILVTLMLMNARWLVGLFNSNTEVIGQSIAIMNLIIPFYPVCCLNVTYAAALRGTGHAKISAAMTLFSYVVLRQGYLVLVQMLGNSFLAVIFVYPLGWVASCAMHALYYHIRVYPREKGEKHVR